jgi:hypothetical protein
VALIPTSPLVPARPLRAFRDPIVAPEVPVRESPSVSFGDLVRMLAEGIADTVVPSVTETIDADGNVTFEQGAPREVSLLSLGVTPTFYQFSQSTVEVVMDVKIVESEQVKEDGKRSYGLFAGTADVRVERKLNRDVTAHSKLTATLVPVPMPLRLEPVRTTNAAQPE